MSDAITLCGHRAEAGSLAASALTAARWYRSCWLTSGTEGARAEYDRLHRDLLALAQTAPGYLGPQEQA